MPRAAPAADPEREADDQAKETEAQTAPHEQPDDLAAAGTERSRSRRVAPQPHRYNSFNATTREIAPASRCQSAEPLELSIPVEPAS